MNEDIIDRLRDAATAAGETIEDVPPLRLPAQKRARGALPWLAPVAAAAAVVVAIGAAVVAQRAGGQEAASAPGTLAPGQVAAPKFLAQVAETDIVIRTTKRGREVERIPGPSEREWFVHVQATRDNRLFYAATETADCSSRLFRFTLDEDGRVASSEPLPYGPPKGVVMTSLAVSGDGGKVGYGMHSCDLAAADGRIAVHDTATGRSRTWSGQKPVTNLSMSADGRYVAFREAALMTLLQADHAGVDRPSGGRKGAQSVSPGERAAGSFPEPAASGQPPEATTGPARPRAETGTEAGDRFSEAPSDSPPAEGGATATDDPFDGAENPGTGDSDAAEDTGTGGFDGAETTDRSSAAPDVALTLGPSDAASALSGTITPDPVAPPILEPRSPTEMLGATTPSRAALEERSGTGKTWIVRAPDPRRVRILDTAKEGSDLGQTHLLTLNGSTVGAVLGVVISPDGRRMYAGVGHPDPAGSGAVRGGIAEFDTAQGALLRPITQVGAGWVHLLDGDGGAERFIVRRGTEYGVVDSGEYRKLVDVGNETRTAVSW